MGGAYDGYFIEITFKEKYGKLFPKLTTKEMTELSNILNPFISKMIHAHHEELKSGIGLTELTRDGWYSYEKEV